MYQNQKMPTTFPQFIPPTSGPSSSPAGQDMTVYLDSAPYPEVSGGQYEPEALALLKESYAGALSELTAITAYVFQTSRMGENEAYANAALQIAIVEMMHLDMLGDAIETLGGVPSFDDGKTPWTAKNTPYPADLKSAIEGNIKAETGIIANYEKFARETTNPTVRALFERIAKDHRLHLKFFEGLQATV